jgi:hypothetical protein
MKMARGLITLVLFCSGCSKSATKSDSYTVVKHVVDGDRYTILHGDVQIEAVCRYSTYTPRGTDKTDDAHCMSTPPVGQELSGKRGEGYWLFIDWKANDAEWHMGLQVEKEKLGNVKHDPEIMMFTLGFLLGHLTSSSAP